MCRTLKITVLITILGYSRLLPAGGPLVLEGTDGHTPVRYQSPVITLHLESGNLDPLRDNAEANAIVQQAFSLWSNVSTSTIMLTTEQLNVDIDSNNYLDYIPDPDPDANNRKLNADDGYNPIVYDEDGNIIKAYFGDQSDLIAGFAASIYLLNGDYFKEGYAVINGNTQSALNDAELTMLIAHEIAHFFGLDHSQAGINNQDSYFCSSDIPENYPLMYPILCRRSGLHADDISWVSALYPKDNNLRNSYGALQGRFVDESDNAILGANIWVENITTGETISVVSDYLVQGNGYYRLMLPAGRYTLHANSINTLFYESSGVGPYSRTPSDISFTAPHPIVEVSYLGADSIVEVITILPNQTVTIDFSSTGSSVTLPTTQTESDSSSGSGLFSLSYTGLLILFGLLTCRRFVFELVKRRNKF